MDQYFTNMGFGPALACLEDGKKVQRSGWGVLVMVLRIPAGGAPFFQRGEVGGNWETITLKTEDLLAEDWQVVE